MVVNQILRDAADTTDEPQASISSPMSLMVVLLFTGL
jgi:hypothetical protein